MIRDVAGQGDGNGIRGERGLGFEALVDRLAGLGLAVVQIHGGGIPGHQQLLAFGGGQQRDLGKRLVRIGGDGGQ